MNLSWLVLIVAAASVVIGVANLLRIQATNRRMKQGLSRESLAGKLDPEQRAELARQIREHAGLREKLRDAGLGDLEESLTDRPLQ